MRTRQDGSTVTGPPDRRWGWPATGQSLVRLLVLGLLVLASCTRPSPQPSPIPDTQPTATTVASEGGPRPSAEPSGTHPPAAPAHPLPGGPPNETLLAFGELLDEEGRLSLETALAVFAGSVAPLPGVVPQQLPGDDAAAVGELAARVLLSNLDRLPPEVAQAVEQAVYGGIEEWIEIPPSGRTSDRLSGTLAGVLAPPPARAQGRADVEHVRALVENVRGRIEERAGRRLRLPLRVGLNPRLGSDTDAVASPVLSGNSRVIACRIAFNPAILGNASAEEVTAAHEVWHCFQFDYVGLAGDERSWLVEGQAEWVGAAIATDPSDSARWWNTWLGAPHVSLWRRSYDAIGLYAAAEAAGHDPFEAMLEMFRLRNQEAVSRLFGGRSYEEALQIVAQSLVRSPEFGPEWEASGPGITTTRATATLALRPDVPDVEASLDAGPFGSLPLDVSIDPGDRPLVQVTVFGEGSGSLEFPGHGPLRLAPGAGIWFCLRPEECTCPDGSPPWGGADPTLLAEPRGVATVFAPAGGTIGLRVRAVDRDEACSRLVGTWTASIMEILAANLAPYGGVPAGMDCSGDIVMTFRDDGTFERSWQGDCQMSGSHRVIRGAGRQTGTYEDLGDELIFRDVRTVVTADFGFSFAVTDDGGPATYRIEGDRLAIQFTTPDGATIVQIYRRAG
jgi:hypothetical protein